MQHRLHHRRRFIAATCSAAAATLVSGLMRAEEIAPKPRIRKAVKFHMVTENLSVFDKFKLLKELGFDGTEITPSSKLDPGQIADAIQQTGLPVHGVVNSSNPNLRAAIDLAKTLGANSVLVVAEEDAQQFNGWATAEVAGGDRKRLAGIAAWMDQVLGQ